MKFTVFRSLVEKYKQLLEQGKVEQANNILCQLDPDGLGLKRYFVVKKNRVEKIIETYCEENDLSLSYATEDISNKGYCFIVKINNESYKIKCQTKKAVGYIHLKGLYKQTDSLDGVDELIKDYPEMLEGIWKVVLDTNNEHKRRELVSINMKIARNTQEAGYLDKEKEMLAEHTKELTERKQEILDDLDNIEVGITNICKV